MDPVRPETTLDRLLGDQSAERLDRELGLSTAGQLLDHLPRRYIDYGELSSFLDLVEGEHVTFVGEVVSSSERRMQRRRGLLVEITVEDSFGGRLRMAFFQGYRARRDLTAGVRAMFHGKVGSYGRELTMNNPEYSVLSSVSPAEGAEALDAGIGAPAPGSGPMPIYPARARISSWEIQRCVRIVMDQAELDLWSDPVPRDVLAAEALPLLGASLRMLHTPQTSEEWQLGLRRMRFQEAFMLQGLLASRRRLAEQRPGTPRPPRSDGLLAALDARLPFALTEGQGRCGELLSADLSQQTPMNRLLQGEVGSGKTLVALRAMLQTVDAGGQAALIAPTEVLAAQHERSLRRMLGGLAEGDLFDAAAGGGETEGVSPVRITLLTGSLPAAERRQALLDIASGRTGIVVGTHAVLGEQVQFAELGLAVVDEQHRFGVEQRSALRSRYEKTPHMLVMSATPIPRSVAMTVFGDLELTGLEGLPAGRQRIDTHLVPMSRGPRYISRVWERAAEEAESGRQVYVVCPKITASSRDSTEAISGERFGEGDGFTMEAAEAFAAEDASVELIEEKLASHPRLGVLHRDVLHGRMESVEKERVMTAFERGEIDVLISTTVVEVGVDVPNATMMAILDADAFGVSTLHQLRGRIGRGGHPGLCLLVTRMPEGHPSMERLQEVAEHSDGMELARLDLERRREGDVLGASQAGKNSTLKRLRIVKDAAVIERAAEYVGRLTREDPDWEQHPQLRTRIEDWLASTDADDEYIERG